MKLLQTHKMEQKKKLKKDNKPKANESKNNNNNLFLYDLGQILNDYQNILSSNTIKDQITRLNTNQLRKSLSLSSDNCFKLNNISDPIEYLIYILDLINKENFEDIHSYFHLKLVEEIRCNNFCPYKKNKQYDEDNFIYQIYVEEIINYIKNHKLDFDEYRERLFMLSYLFICL